MKVWVNGEWQDFPSDATVAQAVEARGADPGGRGVAVAVNGEVVPRDRWQQTRLDDGDAVEVLTAVQGG